jgi:hypothetical protein
VKKRTRLNLYLEQEHARRLGALATMKGATKSSIVALALTSYFAPDAGEHREINLSKRLDRLVFQFAKLERDQNILMETLALYVRFALSSTVPIADAHQEAARSQGRERFAQFVTQLAAHLQDGNSLVRDLHREMYPEQTHDGASGDPMGMPS